MGLTEGSMTTAVGRQLPSPLRCSLSPVLDPEVTVIVPTYNSAATIRECLDSIFSQIGEAKTEVIVVDGRSQDGTVDIARNYPARILFGGKPPGEKRNIGARNAHGEILAFIDSDCRADPRWLSRIVSCLEERPDIAGVGGPNLTPPDDPFPARIFGLLMASFLGSAGVRNTVVYRKGRYIEHNPPCDAAYRRDIFLRVGGFDESMLVGEDVVLDARINAVGRRLWYDPEMIVWHRRRRTLRAFLTQMVRYGRGRATAFKLHPRTAPVSYFCAAALVVGTILTLPIWVLLPVLRLPAVVGWSGYGALVSLGTLTITAKNRNPMLLLLLPPLAVLHHLSLGLGFLVGLARSEHRTEQP